MQSKSIALLTSVLVAVAVATNTPSYQMTHYHGNEVVCVFVSDVKLSCYIPQLKIPIGAERVTC